jgi:spore maturation protein SpmA
MPYSYFNATKLPLTNELPTTRILATRHAAGTRVPAAITIPIVLTTTSSVKSRTRSILLVSRRPET